MQQVLRVTWQVAPLHCPLLWRHCSRCKIAMPFACSMKFRTNAQKKRIDVWLIYRCCACDGTWNLPIHERVAIDDIAPDEFQAIAHSDPAFARRCAFDRERLARHGVRVEEGTEIAIRKVPLNGCPGDADSIEIALALASPCRVRLDRLLSGELGVTRSRLGALHDRGALRASHAAKALRAPIADGQRISIDLRHVAISAGMAAIIRRGAVACSPVHASEEGIVQPAGSRRNRRPSSSSVSR